VVGPCIDMLHATYCVMDRLKELWKTENFDCASTRHSEPELAKHGMLRCSCARAQNGCV